MPQVRGTELVVGLFDETTYGADPGAPDGMKMHLRAPFNLRTSEGLINSETLNTDRSRAKPIAGNKDVGGSIIAEIAAEWIGKILRHSLGANSTSGANPYTHTITIGASLPVGMTIDRDIGALGGGTNRYEKFNGVRVASMEAVFPAEGFPTITWELKGAKGTLGTTALDATLTDHGHTPFSMISHASIEEGGSSIATVLEAKIKLENELDEDQFVIGGGGIRGGLPEGFATISGEITALFSSDAILNKAANGTASSLKVVLSRGTGAGSAGNESIEFLVEQLLFERTSATVEGPAGVRMTFPFLGYKSGADKGLKITLKNAVATI